MPCRTGAFYNNLTEFDWTLGLRRSVENLNYAKIDYDGNHFIGGSSLVLSTEEQATSQVIRLQDFEVESEADEEAKWQGKIAFHIGDDAGSISTLEFLPYQGKADSVDLLTAGNAQ